MTTYYIRGANIWLNYYVDGKRYQKSTKLKASSENIKIVTKQIIPSLDMTIATGTIYKKKPKTFEYYGSIFLSEKSSNKTYHLKEGYWLRAIEHFKGSDIDSITRLDIKQYLSSLDMKTKSKGAYKSCIKEIFELAVDDGIISFNPALSIKLKADRRESIQYFTREEVAKIFEVATGLMKPYLMIALNTGMRVSEILGLQLIDFKDDGFIHIKRTRTKGMIGNGKTRNAIRKVPYSEIILDEVKKFQSKDSLFIFGNRDDASKLRRAWKIVLDDSGVRRHKLYSTRHTFATTMLKEGRVSINELAGLLGHSSPKITLERYASIINVQNIDLGKNFSLFSDTTVTIEKKKAE